MSIEQVVNVVEIAIHKLPYMESLYQQAKDQAEKMQRTIQRLTTDIRTLESKISILDKTAFSIELDCKRTEQQLQELIAKKDRIEKLIATMLSDDNEDYTKLKAIVKESVKAALSDNKMLISISFAALLQTLEDNPEMANLIYSIPLTNNREQYEDNNNNITKYFEVNKASIIDLAEKHYENLVEALTNNVINTAAGAASNPPPSLPSSSAFLGPYNKSDTYKTDKEEMFHHSKGDIAD
jgi:chromosome segregation ATPase